MFSWKFWKAQQVLGERHKCKADNLISALLQIALICEVQGDGDALYSE